jgi:hypothetical protein
MGVIIHLGQLILLFFSLFDVCVRRNDDIVGREHVRIGMAWRSECVRPSFVREVVAP